MTDSPQASAPPIVLVHGLWLTPRSWEGWKERFEARGREVHAPAWPRMEGEVEDLRRDPARLNGLGIQEIVDHYASFIGTLDRGLGAAAVAISPAPFKGVLRLPPAQIKSAFPVLGNPANRSRTVELTLSQFQYAFTNTMDEAASKEAYERYEVPGPGRVIFQAAFANFNPHAPTKVDFHKDDRAPLLVIGNDQDHTVPASVSKEAAGRLGKSKAVVDYKEFAGRPHFTAGAPGWEVVADYALEWADRHTGVAMAPA